MTDRYPPRIYRVETSAPTRRTERGRFARGKAVVHVKVPYGHLYGLTETLTRALTQGELRWYRIEVATHITPEIRASLTRWPEALQATTEATAVRFNA